MDFHHQLKGAILDAVDEGVAGLALGIIYGERATLFGHRHRRAVSRQGERLVNLHGEVCRLLGAVAQPHGGEHVALGRDANARAASQPALVLDFLPQVVLGELHLVALRVALDFLHYEVDFLKLHVHDVVHYALSQGYMLAEQPIVEVSLVSERVDNV